ncbi:MAG: hypothetical protein WKF94_19015 [Solirubrobacteraceae bacterium]
MPVNFGLWRVDGQTLTRVEPASLSAEERLEDFVEGRIDILGLGDLLIVGRQVITEFGKRIDLVAIDAQGDVFVLELKKDRTPREVVAQALEYGFWIGDLSYEDIAEIYATHHDGEDFASGFSSHFEAEVPETINAAHRLIIVASRMDQSTEQIVTYLGRYDVPINVLFFEYLVDGDREYLARTWLADPEHGTGGGRGTTKKQPPWNGTDYFVAVGENENRNWDDMRRYGFVSAGHGDKYRRAMSNLSVGARVFAYIPGTGYVGVGEVIDEAVRVDDFVVEQDGSQIPILQAPLEASGMAEDSESEELSEYLARIRWIDARDRDHALREKGMFANQNVVAKLRQPFTLQRLAEYFNLDASAE